MTTTNQQSLTEQCSKQCLECTDVASRCASACLGSEQMAQCARLCLDCATLTAA